MECRARIAAEPSKRCRRCREGKAVSRGVSDEQDHDVDPAVALLPVQPAFERLEVVEDCLRLDGNPPSSAFDEQVPRSQVAPNRQRDLGRARKARVDARSKAIEQSLLTGVADRIAPRIAAYDQIEPNRRAPGADVLDGNVIDPATLEAEQLLMRCARRRGNGAQAQSRTDPCRTGLAAE